MITKKGITFDDEKAAKYKADYYKRLYEQNNVGTKNYGTPVEEITKLFKCFNNVKDVIWENHEIYLFIDFSMLKGAEKVLFSTHAYWTLPYLHIYPGDEICLASYLFFEQNMLECLNDDDFIPYITLLNNVFG